MRKGQLLVEVLIAISVAMVALVGLIQVSNKSINNAGFARRQAEATTYGSELMEWIVTQKNISGWEGFVTHSSGASGTPYCFTASPPTAWPGIGSCTSSNVVVVASPATTTQYVRQANLITGVNEILVSVTVTWTEGGRTVSSKQDRTIGRY